MLFKKYHLEKVLRGEKTMTRRFSGRYKLGHEYPLQWDWYHYLPEKILITRKFRERLGDISEEDAKKEGGYTPDSFREEWIRINGEWDPDVLVWVYEFKLMGSAIIDRL